MSLDRILQAESVAIVGASKVDTKRGFQAIRILLDEKYDGRIYPVNPKEKSVLGLKCYNKVSDIEEPVDLALITTPAKTIPAVLEDCGKKGLDMIAREHFDIILLDLMMPGLSGFDVLSHVKALHPDTSIIVITGYATLENSIEAMKKGSYHYLTKPLNLDEIRATIQKALFKKMVRL